MMTKGFDKKEERCATGIQGFDKLCEGGFIEDSLNLIVGNAGSGKTTFLLQFLYNGATKFNENGLYLSFEPEIKDLNRAGMKQGMNFQELDKQGKCKIIKANPNSTIKSLQEDIGKLVIKNDIKRICIDPVNVFSLSLPKELNMRKQLYDLLSWLKGLGVCVLVAGESDEDFGGKYDISDEIKFTKYSVDCVVELFSSGISGKGDRALRISKMRMTKHFRGPIGMEITDKGMKVLDE